MKKIYQHIEAGFEKLTGFAMSVLGNSLTFLVAVVLVISWLTGKEFMLQPTHQKIENLIVSITFLTLFAIQKEFKRFSASLHIKLNELVAANDTASNLIMNVEEKTELELVELTKKYAELATAEAGKPQTPIDEPI